MTNLPINKTGLRQTTHADTKMNNVSATNGDAEKKSNERTNCMKKRDVEEQIIRKKKNKENATRITDAKCNDAPTV
jgi:hypothetical protein